MSEIITQTVSPRNYCKYEHTMCEFANDRGYCLKSGCSKRIIINEKPYVNKNLVEVVRCGDCESWDTEHSSGRRSLGNYVCICQEWSDAEDSRWVYTGEDEYCSRGERRAKMEAQDETN